MSSTAWNHPRATAQRVLDFTLSFEAVDKPVKIVGTSDGKKGFGGFCFRFAPRDGGTAKTIIRTEKGLSAKDGVLGNIAGPRWPACFKESRPGDGSTISQAIPVIPTTAGC